MAAKKLKTVWVLAFIALCLGNYPLCDSMATAAPISWQVGVQEAISEADKTGKPLFVTVSTSWCHYCIKMERETLSDVELSNHIQKCFVPLKIDGDANRELIQALGVDSFPTTLIMSSKMEVLQTLTGFRTAVQLDAALDKICQSQGQGAKKHHRLTNQQSSDSRTDSGTARPKADSLAQAKTPRSSPFGIHCPVTSYDEKQLVRGRDELILKYRGYEVHFVSHEALQRFEAQPHKFWPMLDGHCVVTALEDGLLRRGLWEQGVAYADRVWFFTSEEQMEKFAERPHIYLQRLVEVIQATSDGAKRSQDQN